jgi:cytochrome o ubiquinol oxidase operon protein cyoD
MNTNTYHGTFKSYLWGFLLCVILSLLAYFLVAKPIFSNFSIIACIIGLALLQAVIQLILFLHLGKGLPQWNLIVFFFMMIVVVILVGGTLWVMYNLDERMMSAPMPLPSW